MTNEAPDRAAKRQALLDEHIKATVDAWPPLTAEARDRLALLLRPPVDERQQRLDDYIKRVVDEAPPLDAEQRDKLALLLTPVRAGLASAVSEEDEEDDVTPTGASAVERMMEGDR